MGIANQSEGVIWVRERRRKELPEVREKKRSARVDGDRRRESQASEAAELHGSFGIGTGQRMRRGSSMEQHGAAVTNRLPGETLSQHIGEAVAKADMSEAATVEACKSEELEVRTVNHRLGICALIQER